MKRLVSVCLLLVLLCSGCRAKKEDGTRVYFLDVGQGDCTLFRTGGGDVLLDAGPEAAQETLCRKLRSMGVREIALLVLSHPDEDHVGGADAVLEAFPTGAILTNGATDGTESNDRLLATAARLEISVQTAAAGEQFRYGEVLFTVLSPAEGADLTAGNDASLVLRAQIGEISVLMTGDAGTATEDDLLARYGAAQLRATVLHAGHHGANTSSSSAFLAAVAPAWVVISCGTGNLYGHPDGRALARLRETGAGILRTDQSGDLTMTTDGTQVSFTSG